MLKSHVDAREDALLAISRVPAGAGHSLHKGTPREAFVREFLSGHLSERVALGSSEIIDATSRPGEARPQMDLVIFKREYPRIDFGGGLNAFLVESVVATIEVKSLLTEAELCDAIAAAAKVKGLKKHLVTSFHAYYPPAIISIVVAYDGPKNMATVQRWIKNCQRKLGIAEPAMEPAGAKRLGVTSPSVDAVFLLGRGLVHFDNMPFTFVMDDHRKDDPSRSWVVVDCPRGSLFFLFLLLTVAVSGVSGSWLDPGPYVSRFPTEQIASVP